MPIPVLFWQHTKGDFAETHHRELELTATLKDTRAGVAQDVRVSFATADAALRQVIFIRDQLLPSAREAYRWPRAAMHSADSQRSTCFPPARHCSPRKASMQIALAAANSARSDLERAAGVPLSTSPPELPSE